MNFVVSILVFFFSIGIGLAGLYLLLGIYGYVTHSTHKDQKQYLNWIVYSVSSIFIIGVLFYAMKDLLSGLSL